MRLNPDGHLLEQAQRGDRRALGQLLVSLQDTWFRFAVSLLGDTDAAADATQETALRFMRQIGSFKGDSQLKTWSLGIALNVVREMRRKRREAGELEELPGGEVGPEALVEVGEERQRVRAALEGLSERQREVVLLRFFEERSTEQTAEAMGCAAGTVKATLHQALRALKNRLSGKTLQQND